MCLPPRSQFINVYPKNDDYFHIIAYCQLLYYKEIVEIIVTYLRDVLQQLHSPLPKTHDSCDFL